MKKIILSLVLVGMLAPLFMACQNPAAPKTTVPENKVELPEEYRKLIGTWEYSTENEVVDDPDFTYVKEITFTEKTYQEIWVNNEQEVVNFDVIIKFVDSTKNTMEICGCDYQIINENKIKRFNEYYTRKTNTPSEGGSTPESGSIDATKFYGSWTFTPTDNKGKSGTLTFNEDGSFSYNGEASAANGTGGTYTLDRNTLTMKYDLSGNPIEESLILSLDADIITLTAQTEPSNVFQRYFVVNSIEQKTITLNKAK